MASVRNWKKNKERKEQVKTLRRYTTQELKRAQSSVNRRQAHVVFGDTTSH